jgi:hypothetical protein
MKEGEDIMALMVAIALLLCGAAWGYSFGRETARQGQLCSGGIYQNEQCYYPVDGGRR